MLRLVVDGAELSVFVFALFGLVGRTRRAEGVDRGMLAPVRF